MDRNILAKYCNVIIDIFLSKENERKETWVKESRFGTAKKYHRPNFTVFNPLDLPVDNILNKLEKSLRLITSRPLLRTTFHISNQSSPCISNPSTSHQLHLQWPSWQPPSLNQTPSVYPPFCVSCLHPTNISMVATREANAPRSFFNNGHSSESDVSKRGFFNNGHSSESDVSKRGFFNNGNSDSDVKRGFFNNGHSSDSDVSKRGFFNNGNSVDSDISKRGEEKEARGFFNNGDSADASKRGFFNNGNSVDSDV